MPAPGDLLGKVDLAAEHKVALDGEFYTTFSDQSPRDEHERLREV